MQIGFDNEKYLIRGKDGKELRKIKYNDIMIITYSKRSITAITDRFNQDGIPAKVEGEVKFSDNEALNEIFRIYSLVADPDDKIALYGALNGSLIDITNGKLVKYRSLGGEVSLNGSFDASKFDDESAKKFDVIMLHLQLAHIDSTVRVGQFRQVVVNIAAHLEKKGTVPAVMARIDTIRKVQKTQFWENASLDSLESVRTELRDLIKLLEETRNTKKFIIDIEDPYETVEGGEDIIIQTTYKQRVIDYLAQHTDNPTLRKIQDFEQLTSGDFAELERVFFEELGTREEYNELAEGHPYKNNVAAFIRVINGIDRKKALLI